VSDHNWQQVEELLHQALALAEEQRNAFLDEACGADEGLRAEVESLLLVGDEISPDYLKSPLSGELGRNIERLGSTDAMSAGQLFAQRYELIRKLGEGGMGQVWLAEQLAPVRRQVALKLIKAGMYDEAVVQRFQSERQSLAIMDHPAIAKVFDAGTTPQGQPYLVMEFVPGLPITEYCDQHKLNIKDRLEIFIQACDGVQHAHQKAIIHRDLKPSNILVLEVDGKAVPRIIDFGLAKTTAPQLSGEFTQLGQFIGTPGYMSPEQVNLSGRDIDTRTDVYALGVVLYVLLTGLQPFETKRREKPALEEWLRQLREEEPPNPSTKVSGDKDTSSATAEARGTEPRQLVSSLRGDLDWIAMKALDRDRTRRYGTPSELAADLRRYLDHEPVVARPASAGYQIRKFVRRHRFAAAFIGMVTVLSVVASGAALIAVKQKSEAEHQAAETLKAQARLLTQGAAQRLKDDDVTGAQGIILEVLTNSEFAQSPTPAAISVFQEARAADAKLAVLSGHAGFVIAAAYSPDGTRVVTASYDKTARIWDARTGAELVALVGHGDQVRSAAYSPDGTRIVTASIDNTARVWDALTGSQLGVLSGHRDQVRSAAYSPDGTRIVTASTDKTARLWDARTGAQLAVLSGNAGLVISAAYSPDGTRIVTASHDKTARIWDADSGAQLLVLSGHGDRLNSAAYSPDGTRIVTTSYDKTARIWDARSGVQLAVLSGHDDPVFFSAAYSPDGTRIVTASLDRTARIWDARTAAELVVLSGHGDVVASAAYSPDGTRIVTASLDKTALIWDAHMGAQLAVLTGHAGFVTPSTYSPDGTRIVTASHDKTARIWDARTGAQLAVLSGHEASVFSSAAYSPDGTRIVTASLDNTAWIWDARTGAEIAQVSGHAGWVNSAAYSPDGTRLVTASYDKTARIWDPGTGAQLEVLSGHGDIVETAAYSPDGTRIVTASDDKTARVWEARTGHQLVVIFGHGDRVATAAYSPDGTHIVTASDDRTARTWDAHTGAELVALSGHGGQVRSAAYSPDGTRIVTASTDKTARIWDARTGEQLAVLSGHAGWVNSAAYSPDGTRIVTASNDKTARIWDARVSATLAAQILWAKVAQTDPLADLDRTELGLPPDARVKQWRTRGSACDQAAAAFYDPDRVTRGLARTAIVAEVANSACTSQIALSGKTPRLIYERARALLAKSDVMAAKQQLELAVSSGYRAAQIDLASLLVDVSAGGLDPERALALDEHAWQDGVPIAAYEVGHLFEFGVSGSPAVARGKLRPDLAKAWEWYQKGADAREPTALARVAEREEKAALAESDASRRNAGFLEAFRLYAAAADRARYEDWPDDAWKHWRYRRATLARLLAREGMMQQVADAYTTVLEQRPPERTLWEKIKNELHL
jgi:eukaryotic-like serine/threonine-protein kinase